MTTKDYQKQVAHALCSGILAYLESLRRIKGEIIYEKTPEKIQIFHDCFMGTLPFCRPAFRKRSCGSGKAFLHKDKTVYFQKQTFHDPMTRKNIVSYDLLGTGNFALGNLSSKSSDYQPQIQQPPY
ncbi:MAG: hypothetical protein ACLR2E_14050 [Lachnospiraceae bacterium]